MDRLKWAGTIVVAVWALSIGCASRFQIDYDIRLSAIETQVDSVGISKSEKYEAASDNSFMDNSVGIKWALDPSHIQMHMSNTEGSPLRVNWDRAAIVLPTGESVRAVHSGIRFVDSHLPQVPSVIVPGTYVEDVVVPASQISYFSGSTSGTSGWSVSPMLPTSATSMEEVKSLTGSKIQLLLPIEAKYGVRQYLFTFQVHDVTKAASIVSDSQQMETVAWGRKAWVFGALGTLAAVLMYGAATQ